MIACDVRQEHTNTRTGEGLHSTRCGCIVRYRRRRSFSHPLDASTHPATAARVCSGRDGSRAQRSSQLTWQSLISSNPWPRHEVEFIIVGGVAALAGRACQYDRPRYRVCAHASQHRPRSRSSGGTGGCPSRRRAAAASNSLAPRKPWSQTTRDAPWPARPAC